MLMTYIEVDKLLVTAHALYDNAIKSITISKTPKHGMLMTYIEGDKLLAYLCLY